MFIYIYILLYWTDWVCKSVSISGKQDVQDRVSGGHPCSSSGYDSVISMQGALKGSEELSQNLRSHTCCGVTKKRKKGIFFFFFLSISSISQFFLEHTRSSTDTAMAKLCLNVLQNGFNLEIVCFFPGLLVYLGF